MRKLLLCGWITCLMGLCVHAQDFDTYFFDKTLRFDFFHAGNATDEAYFFDELKEEPYWAGSKSNLIDDSGLGEQCFKIVSLKDKKTIYSHTYCTLFNEWQTVAEAKTASKAMPEGVVFPFPKDKVRIEFYTREKGEFVKKYEQEIDPNSYFIKPFSAQYDALEIMYNGNATHRVDIVLIPEGYTASQKDLFKADCEFFVSEFFKYSPFKENRSRFNVRAVWAPSREEGVTIPGEHVWKNSITNARFYTFDTERYQMIEDYQTLRDIAAHVPYDIIYVLSNTQKYGGGGIYNQYGISAAHHPGLTGKIYVHEFGHLFAGLGDEYIGGVAYNEYYKSDEEPYEPNLTTLVHFENKKWKSLLDKNTPIPTIPTAENRNLLGVYEGGGYVSKGVFRPMQECIMGQMTRTDDFCTVCSVAIQDRIQFICE